MDDFNCRISENGDAHSWYWEVFADDQAVLGRGLALTRDEARVQAEDYIALLKSTKLPPWKHAC